MPLRLIYRAAVPIPVEVEGITPQRLRDCSRREIEHLTIVVGNQQVPLAELFRVEGHAGDESIWWEGDLAGVHWLGAGMSSGSMLVDGNVGRHAGSGMRGGSLHVHGDCGDWLAAEMRGGLVNVKGSAGHSLGAAYRGSRVGMRGGTIVVAGSAGNEAGHSMRRGMIAVGGAIGDLTAMHMRAGTVLAFGSCGDRPAVGMIRGTLGLLGNRPPLLPTFRSAGRCRPLVLRLLLRRLAGLGLAAASEASEEIELFHGDLLEGGRGEIWLRPGR